MRGFIASAISGARLFAATVFVFATIDLATIATAEPAQADLNNPNVVFDYYEPRSPDFAPLYAKLQGRGVLEELSRFLAPIRWPKKVRLLMKECPPSGIPKPEVFYSSLEYSITICYQWLSFLGTFTPPATFATRQEVIVGGLVGVVLNAAGHAAFDMLNGPRLGADEDAADQIASYVALQFGPNVARTVIKGTYYVWDTYEYYARANNVAFNIGGSSSVFPQRKYNILCIAYGGDKNSFQDFVDTGLLPRSRADRCTDEYAQVSYAFAQTVLPSVDTALLKKVQSMQWLAPEDLQ